MKKSKILHILIIILGIFFILVGAFHTNLWFDETYSVGIVNHSFKDIWLIGAQDVHPILYYFLLKIVNLIFGTNILAYRLFSSLGIMILGILGYTHIRKDFGNKTGIIFSFLSFFLPVMAIYASEIRMYSWVITFVTLMGIYAYRITKEPSNKNYIIFAIFSLFSAYTHYYGLMISFFINLFLFIYLIKQKRNLKKFIMSATIQIILYIPWLVNFIKQLTSVSKGFWITFKFPDTLIEVLKFQFSGNLTTLLSSILTLIVFIYVIWLMKKNKEEKIGFLGIGMYLLIFLLTAIISLKAPLLVPRYMFVVTGLLIFSFSYFMAKGNKYITISVCLIILGFSIMSNVNFINENYDKSNNEHFSYLKENVKEKDFIIYTNVINSTVFLDKIDHTQYFYNIDNWNIKEAYEAYSPKMKIIDNLDILDGYKGRIWIIDGEDSRLYNLLSGYELVEEKTFNTRYHNLNYKIYLLRS